MDLSGDTTDLQGLEAEIEQVKTAIQSLREKQRHLQSLRNLKLPFFYFPPEICVSIFSFACHKGRLPNDQNQVVVTTPFIISGVCRAWRALVRSAPELWSSASLCVGSVISGRSIVQEELFRQWLHLAKTMPLSISITYDEQGASETRQMPLGTQAGAISVAASHSHQWESVDLTLPSLLLLSIRCRTFPNLHSLSLQLTPRNSSIPPLPSPIFLDAPKLRIADLDCGKIDVGLPYHQLEELTLRGYDDIAPCLSLLCKCLNLTFCRIVTVPKPTGSAMMYFRRPTGDISHHLSKPVRLLKLVSLETTESEPFKLLACIEAPVLRSITIPLKDVHQMKALFTFLTRSNAMLQRLKIIDHIPPPPEEEEFLKMLDALPHLSHLEINEIRSFGCQWLGPSQKFFDYLTTPHATSDNLPLPALTSFKYHGPINFKSDNRQTKQWDDKYQFNIDSLEKMLISRWNANISFNSTSRLQSFIMSIQSPHKVVAHMEQSPVVQKLRKEGMHLVFELAEEGPKRQSSFYANSTYT